MTKDQQTQLLILTMEECGELIRACSKVYRRNHDEKSIIQLLEEAGDVYAMIEMLISNNYFTLEDLKQRAEYKKTKIKSWSS